MQKPSSKFLAWLSAFIFCFLFWLLLTWSVAPRELILGGVVSAIVAAFSGRFLIHHQAFYLYNPVRLIVLIFYCAIIFLWDAFPHPTRCKANTALPWCPTASP